jgi:hypothetical protein
LSTAEHACLEALSFNAIGSGVKPERRYATANAAYPGNKDRGFESRQDAHKVITNEDILALLLFKMTQFAKNSGISVLAQVIKTFPLPIPFGIRMEPKF